MNRSNKTQWTLKQFGLEQMHVKHIWWHCHTNGYYNSCKESHSVYITCLVHQLILCVEPDPSVSVSLLSKTRHEY